MSAAGWKSACALVAADFRRFYPGAVALSILWLGLTPLLFGIANLDAGGAGHVLEQYAAIVGVFLLPMAFLPEQDQAVRETVEAKRFPRAAVFVGRLFLSAALILALLGILVLALRLLGGSFPVRSHLFGAFATAMLLGALCLFTLGATGNVVAGYLPPLLLYLLCLCLGPRRLGKLYLFGLSSGIPGGKGLLTAFALALTASAMLWRAIRQKIR